MVALKRSEMRRLDTLFQSAPGYVLDFSDRTFAEFFEDELGIDIDDERYRSRGKSKMNRLRAFVELEEAHLVARALRALFQHRIENVSTADPDIEEHKQLLDQLVERWAELSEIANG